MIHNSGMDPFGELGVDLSSSELRETAYEILVGACRSSGSGRRLTYVSSSNLKERSQQQSQTHKSAASKVKKALGLKPKKKKKSSGEEEDEPDRKSLGELMRVQMRVPEQTDSRIRRGFLRVAAGQLGRRIESMVLPLELLQHFRSSDFSSEREYEAWQRRNLKILEAGLLIHPHVPLDKSLTAPQRLRHILHAASEKPIDTDKHSESMLVLCNVVTSLACRSFDGSTSDICHWADGIPLNLHLYKILIEACFDVNDEASVVEEVDDVLDQVKKTWVILGIDQVFHNLCFLWVLFHQYIATGETENDLLFAVDHMMVEVVKDADLAYDPKYSKILSSTLSLILDWADKRLSQYHEFFHRVNIDVMQSVLTIGVSAARVLMDISREYDKKRKEVDVACSRVDAYIRSSVRNTFSQEREKLITSRKSSKNQQSPLPLLCLLAQNICDMAFNEKEIYSPILKTWHPHATSVAVATLHACYAKELKKFVSSINELNPEAIQVLLAAEKLEKDLVDMAVADSLDSEDGGKSTIQEMTPYESQAVITNLVKSWIQTRLDRLREWVDRNLQQEDWNPQVNKGRFAPSAVEVLRIVDETLEAFFLLPIPIHPVLLPELIGGLDRCLQKYIIMAKSGCGSRVSFISPLPALTRCATGSKFRAFKRKDRSLSGPGRKSQVYNRDGDDLFSVPRQCFRINTLYNIRKELESLERRMVANLKNNGLAHDVNAGNGNFSLSIASSMEGIRELSEAIAYKVVFHDLSHVLGDYLYLGEVSSSRVEPFLEELEQNLEIISVTVHDRVRTRVIIDVMKASFEGFLLVLLAGGPSRAFSVQDARMIDEDLKSLSDLFWSNGDGLPADVIDKVSAAVRGVVSLFETETESLVEKFKHVSLGSNEVSAVAKWRPPLPPTTGQWSATDPNTILRVLCHRNDKIASKFLKKTFDMPKKI
ncbi:protein unc-13 homolog [Salvia miltiorrhiza]|uniref:protein unc-13 homolog n=1 Tax=Salvia miltiorrhiza TaxID=226208 RepID=UPI0025ACEEC1|nr:protein unc-13 homolog [Salvia miltiorrhiza]